MYGRQQTWVRTFGVWIFLLFSGVSIAQVDNFLSEEESKETVQEDSDSADTLETDDDTHLDLSILFEKLSQLESENRFLVGRIEQLEYEFGQFRQENRERYTELDDRVRGLSGQATSRTDSSDGIAPDQDSEDGLYQHALLLIQEKKYDEAISVFSEMIQTYPNGRQVPNGFYYLGELYTTIEPKELERARQNFVQLTRLYPKHAKIPEAKYKLGTIYDELGDDSKALDYLDGVVREYPGTSASRLAKEYAETMREIESLQDTSE